MKALLTLASLIAITTIILSFGIEHSTVHKSVFNDSLEKDRAKYIKLITEKIKGKENVAVDSVFMNLKILRGFPAENLVFAMESWSRALGVSCGHCHNTNDFADDTKQKKQIAREMVTMGSMIADKLKTISGLSERPIVNCITCHRGEEKPAFRMP